MFSFTRSVFSFTSLNTVTPLALKRLSNHPTPESSHDDSLLIVFSLEDGSQHPGSLYVE